MNKFLRTAPMSRLLAAIAAVVVVIAGGTAIALAATSGGPVPKAKPLPVAIRDALKAKPVSGFSASIKFTNNLLPSFELQGSDPLLSGGSGQIWVSNDGQLRLELYSNNGNDPQIVVTHSSWWVYDPTLNTVYEGTIPPPRPGSSSGASTKHEAVPTIAQIQTALNRLAANLHISGAIPSDVGGQPTYTVRLSPKHPDGLIGQLQLAWDANHGVPLRFALYRRGDRTPVLELAASNISYASIPSSDFNVTPSNGARVVKVATPTSAGSATTGKKGRHPAEPTGLKAVQQHVSFKLAAPASLAGNPRSSVSLLDMGGHKGALLSYGQGLGAIEVIEQPATATSSQKLNLTTGSGDHTNGITLPTVRIKGISAQELQTTIGTIVRFTSGNVTYTVLGAQPAGMVVRAARGL